MKKLNFRVILLQLLGMIFLIHGVLQLRFYTVAEEFICATTHNSKSECWNELFPTKESFFDFWPGIYIWIFLGLMIGILLVSFLNWKYKFSSLNTILVAIVMYVVLRLKFYRRGVFSHLFDFFAGAFSDDYVTRFFIGGITFTLLGIMVLWLSVKPNWFAFKNKTISN